MGFPENILKWGGVGGGAMSFIFLLLLEIVNTLITFGTDVFSIRKKVRK